MSIVGRRRPPRDPDPELRTLNSIREHLMAAAGRLDAEEHSSLAAQIASREVGRALRVLDARRDVLLARGHT